MGVLVVDASLLPHSASRSPPLSVGLCPGLLPKLCLLVLWPWLLGFDVSVEVRPACFSLSDRHIEYVTPSNGCLGASRCARGASCFCRGLWGVVVFICYSCRLCLVSLPLLPLSDRVWRVSPILGRKLSANYRMAQHRSRKLSANYRLTASNYRIENPRKRPFLTK